MAALATTTLSRATTAADSQWYLASGSSVTIGTVLFSDGEAVTVTAQVTSTCFQVQRGQFGSNAAAHASGATVYKGTPEQFYQTDPEGVPVTDPITTPWINTLNGAVWTVSGSAWVLANSTANPFDQALNTTDSVTFGAAAVTAGLSAASLTISGGTVILADLPTADPAEAGQLWNDTGTLKVSAG